MKLTNEIKRKAIQVAAFGFSNAHAGNFAGGKLYTGKWKQFCNPGLNCYSCPAASLACPIGALQAVSGSMNYSLSFYVWGFLLAIGVLLGRFICGWICPFGLIQELMNKIPTKKIKLPKPFTYIKYVVLVLFVMVIPVAVTNYMGVGKPAFCEFVCPSGTLLGGIPMMLTHPELRSTVGGLFALKVTILIIIIVGCIFIFRFFCKAICPLGAIYGLLNKISIYHLEIDTDACVSCGKCSRVCKMDVDPVKCPNSVECIRCGDCKAACPKGAISIGFGKKYKKSRKKEEE